jgi:hypothetical protein
MVCYCGELLRFVTTRGIIEGIHYRFKPMSTNDVTLTDRLFELHNKLAKITREQHKLQAEIADLITERLGLKPTQLQTDFFTAQDSP